MPEITECPDCASTNVIYSKVEKGIICRDCGGVFVGKIVPEKKPAPKLAKPIAKKAAKKPAKKSKAKKKRR